MRVIGQFNLGFILTRQVPLPPSLSAFHCFKWDIIVICELSVFSCFILASIPVSISVCFLLHKFVSVTCAPLPVIMCAPCPAVICDPMAAFLQAGPRPVHH